MIINEEYDRSLWLIVNSCDVNVKKKLHFFMRDISAKHFLEIRSSLDKNKSIQNEFLVVNNLKYSYIYNDVTNSLTITRIENGKEVATLIFYYLKEKSSICRVGNFICMNYDSISNEPFSYYFSNNIIGYHIIKNEYDKSMKKFMLKRIPDEIYINELFKQKRRIKKI